MENENLGNISIFKGNPVGAVIAWPGEVPSAGYLECAGQWLGEETYPDLFLVVGHRYESEANIGYFQLPDYRGEFLRGWDHGRGIDSERELGSSQGDAIREIEGRIQSTSLPSFMDMVSLTGSGAFVRAQENVSGYFAKQSTSAITNSNPVVIFKASNVVPTSTENRPRNISVSYCIKAFDGASEPSFVNSASAMRELADKAGRADIEAIPGRRLWISEEIKPILSTATVVTHNLNLNPLKCRCDVLLKCVTAENGYSIGDYATSPSVDSAYYMPLTPSIDKLSIKVSAGTTGSGLVAMNGAGNNRCSLTLANWRYIFRIWH